jgi:hypothetical protein
VHLSPSLRIATWRDVFFEMWTQTGGVDDVRTLHRKHAEFLQQHDGQVAAVSVIQIPSLKSIGDDVRAEVKARLTTIRDRTSASLTVLESTGFTASVIRSLIGGLILFARTPYPHKVEDSVDRGANWLAPLLAPLDGRPVPPGQVRAIYDFLLAAEAS